MAKGGARNRSGPPPDPTSERSERRGLSLSALPAEGYDGAMPEFPLPAVTVWWEYYEDKKKCREVDESATEARRERELALWAWAWRTPQAAAWAREPWRWHTVAMWVRTSAVCESPEATAADKNSLHRFADQIGLTPAGLRENGWAVASDEVTARRSGREVADEPVDDVRSRLTVVPDAAAG